MLAVCGDSGSGKSTLSKVISAYLVNSTVVECDRYHKWERGSSSWKTFTHLNPEANHLSLMNGDALILKSGLPVFRREYDHSTGTFTEDQLINPSKNIVMCGLHTFYDVEDLYNLKIFMETDKELKTQWKIARDSNKRGYSTSEVKEQIRIRQTDYNKFLKPKAKDADLIVNFRSDVGAVDAAKGIGRSLRIFVRDTYDIKGILAKFKEDGAEILNPSSSRPGFFELNVETYRQIDKNYYYDYIMVCILDLLIQCVKN